MQKALTIRDKGVRGNTLALKGNHMAAKKKVTSTQRQINKALKVAFRFGQTDGDHHKAWVIDQMVKALTSKDYKAWVKKYEGDPKDEDNHYSWDKGTAP